MNLDQVRTIAKSRGVHPGKLSKSDLIKSIQVKEGNFDCFASARNGECDQVECSWRKDCFDVAQPKGRQS
ncbi:MAG: SAP domain-containing protein [Gallionellaceae bacterium]|nr:MAG: SAP domain-containing protein [Gallionellaceae bacterium]